MKEKLFGIPPKPERDKLADAVVALSCALEGFTEQNKLQLEWFKSHFALATLTDLKQMEKRIMSVISEFAAKQKAFNERQATAVDGLVTSVSGIAEDIKALNAKIEELQNSPGGITPEDQTLLNELEAAGEALITKVESAAAAAKVLDDLHPPTPPPA